MPPHARSLSLPVPPPSEALPATQADLETDLLPIYLLRFDRPQTRRAYRGDLCQFFGSDFVTLEQARSVTFVHVNEHVQALEAGGARPSTLRRKISSLRGFFAWLLALELITANPADRQVVRRVSRSDASSALIVLTRAQAQRLLKAAESHGHAAVRDRALLLVLLHGALRRSEAAAMDVEHVRRLGEFWVLDLPQTKGGADQYVKLPGHVVAELDALCEHYGFISGPLWRSHSNNSRGRRLTPDGIYGIVKKAAAGAGLDAEGLGAHTLRHTACTLALEAGASLQQIQTHARHRRLETTMAYVHQRDKLRDSAADYIKI